MAFRIRVENFQSIESAEIEVDGFTVITGTNNLGKSAMVRALKGIFTNPAPSFVRKGASHAVVELWSGDNYVRWEKGKNKNSYLLQVGEQEYKFDKPGPKTPDQVCEAFGVVPVQVGNKSVWPQFADQLTGAVFLLDLPGSALADVVANVDRIQVLNKALKKSESEKRKAVSALKLRKSDQAKLDERLVAFAGLDGVLGGVSKLEEQHTKADRLRKGHERLLKLRKDYLDAKTAVDALAGFEQIQVPAEGEDIHSTKAKLAEMRKLRTTFQRAHERLKALDGLEQASSLLPDESAEKAVRKLKEGIRKLSTIRDQYRPAKRDFDRWGGAGKAALEVQFGDAEAAQQTVGKIQKALLFLRGLRKEVTKGREQLARVGDELAQKEQELASLESTLGENLSQLEDCPLCGTSLG